MNTVTPAQAGVQKSALRQFAKELDPRFRGDDKLGAAITLSVTRRINFGPRQPHDFFPFRHFAFQMRTEFVGCAPRTVYRWSRVHSVHPTTTAVAPAKAGAQEFGGKYTSSPHIRKPNVPIMAREHVTGEAGCLRAVRRVRTAHRLPLVPRAQCATRSTTAVAPAKAGAQGYCLPRINKFLDSRLRGNDVSNTHTAFFDRQLINFGSR